MYKSKLHELCQKKAWPLPDYNVSRYGPDHDSRFRATVTVNGVLFGVVDLSKTLKEAVNTVSQVAMEHFSSAFPDLLPPTIVAGSNISDKNQLHSYAGKYLLDLPKYTQTLA